MAALAMLARIEGILLHLVCGIVSLDKPPCLAACLVA